MSTEELAMLREEVKTLQAELAEYKALASDRLTREMAWKKEYDALAARLALIERGCAVLDAKVAIMSNGFNDPRWLATSCNEGGFVANAPTLLALIEKVGGQQ